jgi:hypothetical protein
LEQFSTETLQTHNLDVMSEENLSRLLIDAGLNEIKTGEFGGCLLPRGTLNKTITGKMYKQFSLAWGLGLSLANIILPVEKWSPWQAHIWCSAKKN